jgi:Fur family ferric uptake transcriptional regulator
MSSEHSHDHPTLEELQIRLKKAEISVTPTRLAILEQLAESHRVWSIDQLIQALKKKRKAKQGSLVFTTVYRCLLKMEEAGLVRRADLGDGISRYEFDPGTREHHHHVVCRSCEEIEPLDHCEVIALEEVVKKMGYQEIAHRLEFFGICKPCQKKAA